MNLTELSKEIYAENLKRGFDVSKENFGQTLMLVVSELAEALEADRKGRKADKESFYKSLVPFIKQGGEYYSAQKKKLFEEYIKDSKEDEIADAIIRLFDLCGAFGIDIDTHIELKRWYNSKREYKHGKKY